MKLVEWLVAPGRHASPRVHLMGIVLVTLTPALLFAGWLAGRLADGERQRIETHTQDTARELADALERRLVDAENILLVMATSHHLRAHDVAPFYEKMQEVSRRLGVQITLRDPRSGEQFLAPAPPLAPPAGGFVWPPERLQAEQAALRSGKTVVSNVFIAPMTGEPVVCIVTPIVVDRAAKYVLSLGIPTATFRTVLLGAHLADAAVAAIVDANNIVIARSARHDGTTGKPIPAKLPAGMLLYQGAHVGSSFEGAPFYWAHSRAIAQTGWTVGVGVPVAALEAPFNHMVRNFSIAGALLLGAALAASYMLADPILRTVGALGIDRHPTRKEFELLFQSAPNGVLVVDANGSIVLLNTRIETMFGYSRPELIGRPIELLVPERQQAAHVERRTRYARDPQAGAMSAGRDLFGRRKDGGDIPVEVQLNPISTKAGHFVLAAVIDVSERRRAADELSRAIADRDQMRRRFLQAQEAERLRLAHELHDQSGQSLAAVMVELKIVEELVDDNGRERLRRLRAQLDQMGRTLHHVAWELRPPSIDELGLASAITTYAADWSAQFGIDCDVHCGDRRIDELPDDVRTTIYRVVQEALTNVAKHGGGAGSVSVIIDRVGDTVRLTVEDDGDGFSEAALAGERSDRGGLGLAGMRERVALLGGAFNAESTPGRGTTIFVRIPVETPGTAA